MATFNGREWTVADMLPFKYVENWDDFFDDVIAEMSARTTAVGSALSSTSATSLAIGTGSKSLTVATNKAFSVGQFVNIAVTADATKYMYGPVASYDATTGALVVSVSDATGSGTYAAWTVSLIGPKGATGGASLPAGSAAAPGLAVTGDADTGFAQIGGANTLSTVGGGKEITRATQTGLVINPGRSIAEPEIELLGPNGTEDYIIKRKGDTGLLEVVGVQSGYSGFSFKVNNTVERFRIPNSGPVLVDGVPIGAGLYSGTPSKAANYSIVSGDGGSVIKCTSAVTLTLPAASDLSAGWWVTISNRVAGTVIIAPAGADKLAGVSASWALRYGQDVTVYRTGSTTFELHSLGQSLLDSQATWSPVNKGPGVTLSNNSLTAICPSGNSVRASVGASSGKRYFEILFDTAGAVGFGVATATATLTGVPGADANGWAYLGDGRKYTGNVGTAYGLTIASGNVGRFAHDIDAGKVWVAIGSVWQGGGDPAAGTNPMFTGVSGGTFYPAVGDYNSSTTATGRFSTSSFAFTPPAGFLPYY